MIDDPIVAEVRAIREKLAARYDFDIDRILAAARKRQIESGALTVSFEKKRAAAKPVRKKPQGKRRRPSVAKGRARASTRR